MSTAAPVNRTTGYEVARPAGRCSVCEAAIEPQARFFAALHETAEGMERVDVCPACWERFDRSAALAFWQAVMPQPQQQKKLFVDDQVLCGLFERLAETTEQNKLNFRFVLGLILMRKRLLVYEESRVEEDREIWSVRFRGREDRLDLLNPKLNEQQVAEVSQQLGEILNEEV